MLGNTLFRPFAEKQTVTKHAGPWLVTWYPFTLALGDTRQKFSETDSQSLGSLIRGSTLACDEV